METRDKNNVKDEKKSTQDGRDGDFNSHTTTSTDANQSSGQDLTSSEKIESQEEGINLEVQNIQNELLYLRAEFDNYKKRILREQDQAIKYANEKIIKELLGVVDLLDRGITSGKTLNDTGKTSSIEFQSLLSGIEMIQRELTQLLVRHGVEFVGVEGELFDPAKHEAISQQESSSVKSETVLHVLQKGCLLLGRLITPAKVVVAKSAK